MKASKLLKLEKTLKSNFLVSIANPYEGDLSSMEGVAGVYVLSFGGGRYLYVGQSKNLKLRLEYHRARNQGDTYHLGGISEKYHAVTDKYELTDVFVVDQPLSNQGTRGSREAMWIGIIHKLVGAKRLVNVTYSGTHGEKRTMKLSPEERASRAARMSKTVKALHKDPAYKARMKAIAKENHAKVEPEVRERANAAVSAAAKARFADPKRREFMAEKAKRQWGDPAFREINSNRIRKRLAEHRSGERPFKSKLHLVEVTLPLQPVSGGRRRFLVRPKFVYELFSLPSTSDRGPEKKLPKLLSGAVSIIRKEPLEFSAGQKILPRVEEDEKLLAAHPFIRYATAYRSNLKSWRTKPCIVRTKEGFRRMLSHRKASLGKEIEHVRDYQNLWFLWKDQARYPLLKRRQNPLQVRACEGHAAKSH